MFSFFCAYLCHLLILAQAPFLYTVNATARRLEIESMVHLFLIVFILLAFKFTFERLALVKRHKRLREYYKNEYSKSEEDQLSVVDEKTSKMP